MPLNLSVTVGSIQGGGNSSLSVAESIGITDAVIAARTSDRVQADAVNLADAVAAVQAIVRTQADAVGITDSATAVLTLGGGMPGGNVTHADQLTVNHVGPWTLQGVAKGSETVQTMTPPGGTGTAWSITSTSDWAPTSTYTYSLSTSNHGGVVPAGGLTIFGQFVPAGTVIAQFRDFSRGDFSCQFSAGQYLFIGCRFRNNDIGQSSQFNDNGATYTNRMMYCDMGSTSSNLVDWTGAFWKSIGGTDHVVLRNYFSFEYVTFQPNVPNCIIGENFVEDMVYYGGNSGPPGNGGPLHMAVLGCEGGGTGFRVYRNNVVPRSPDPAGNVFNNGATFAFEGTNGSAYHDCQFTDNLLGGMNYVFLDCGEVAGATNIVITGNKVSTKYFTDGGATGCEQAGPNPVAWGSNGNVKSNNTWADDYGTGGDGNTPTSSRQYPLGNGPRVGTTAF